MIGKNLKNLLRSLKRFLRPRNYNYLILFAVCNLHAALIIIEPNDNSYESIQEALLLAKPGDTVRLTGGTFYLEDSLSLDVPDVKIEGEGMDVSILEFSNQKSGAQGLLVASDNVTLQDFSVLNAKGDAIKAKGVKNISFIRVKTEWSGGPKSTNGAYGLYPVESENVLIDSCVAIGASDAGIYVGQSKNIIVKNSWAKENVAGIEIENSYYADVFNNTATENTGGILVFDLPDLPQQGGHDVRVFNNKIVGNNTDNFAPEGNIVGEVPSGTGIIIMANSNIEIFNNEIVDNGTVGIAVVSYSDEYEDKNYYPHPRRVQIHNNIFKNNGRNPDYETNEMGKILYDISSGKMADIFWDGVVPFSQILFGQPRDERMIISGQDNDAFITINPIKFMLNLDNVVIKDISKFKGAINSLPPVQLNEASI